MSEFCYFKKYEKDTLGTGGSWTGDWDVDEALTIKRIFVRKKSGESLTESTLYLKISEDVLTRPDVPAVILGPDIEVTPLLNLPVKARERISWTFKNMEGAAISVFLVFECEREKSRV